MEDTIPDDVLDRYLSGEATRAERDRVEAWAGAGPERMAVLDALRSTGPERDWDVDSAWRAVRGKIEADSGRPGSHTADTRRHGRRVALLRAAALAALLVSGWTVWRLMSVDTDAAAAPGAPFVTAAAERDTVELPDGSAVIIAPSSRLVVTGFDESERSLELSGEAYFSVVTDAGRPFRVRAGSSLTEVLGTEFSVRARGESDVTVAVREGRVSLTGLTASSAITLGAGQVGRVSGSAAPVLLGSGSGAYLSWLDGVLEFDGHRLGDVVAELSRWLDTRVQLADPGLAERTVTGRFVTTSAAQALDALALTLGVSWTTRDGVYVIGNGRN